MTQEKNIRMRNRFVSLRPPERLNIDVSLEYLKCIADDNETINNFEAGLSQKVRGKSSDFKGFKVKNCKVFRVGETSQRMVFDR